MVVMALTLTSSSRHSFRVFADQKRVVNLSIDGKKRVVVSNAPTVQEILTENGIDLKSGDIVEPEANTVIDQPNYNINVYKAAPAVVEDEGRFIQVVTGYRSARKIAAVAGVTLYPEDKAVIAQVQENSPSKTIGYKVSISRALPVQLIVNNQVINIRTHQPTIGQMLTEKGIEFKPEDIQGATPETPIRRGARVILAKLTQQTAVAVEDVAPTTQIIYDANRASGTVEVRRQGSSGRKQVTYLIEMINGAESKRTPLETVMLVAPVDKIEVRGSRSAVRTSSAGQPSAEQWARLRFCEAGGRYETNTGNGYYGAYQMNIDFWKAYGGNPNILPSQASPAEQDAVAQRGYARRGAQPWPVCGRFLY